MRDLSLSAARGGARTGCPSHDLVRAFLVSSFSSRLVSTRLSVFSLAFRVHPFAVFHSSSLLCPGLPLSLSSCSPCPPRVLALQLPVPASRPVKARTHSGLFAQDSWGLCGTAQILQVSPSFAFVATVCAPLCVLLPAAGPMSRSDASARPLVCTQYMRLRFRRPVSRLVPLKLSFGTCFDLSFYCVDGTRPGRATVLRRPVVARKAEAPRAAGRV